MQSAAQLGGLISAVVALYWYVCLVGQRLKRCRLDAEVRCWGRLGDFKKGLELLSLDHELVRLAADRLLRWMAGKLFGLAPLPKPYQGRCRRHRYLLQSG